MDEVEQLQLVSKRVNSTKQNSAVVTVVIYTASTEKLLVVHMHIFRSMQKPPL